MGSIIPGGRIPTHARTGSTRGGYEGGVGRRQREQTNQRARKSIEGRVVQPLGNKIEYTTWLSLGLSGALPPDSLGTERGGWAFWSLEFAITAEKRFKGSMS
jgi:hypothetical protein